MKDSEFRGIVLRQFYEMRHVKDMLQLSDLNDLSQGNENQLANICDQLGEQGLIEWKPLRGMGRTVAGMGKISAYGVDVIEGSRTPPIALTINDHSVRVSGSQHVQVGSGNTQGVTISIDKLVAAIDHSSASADEKAEAKSLLAKLGSNPIVLKVLGAVAGVVLTGSVAN